MNPLDRLREAAGRREAAGLRRRLRPRTADHDGLIDLASNAYARGLSENLAYAGGCALNSSANGRLIGRTGFKRLHVPSAPAAFNACQRTPAC